MRGLHERPSSPFSCNFKCKLCEGWSIQSKGGFSICQSDGPRRRVNGFSKPQSWTVILEIIARAAPDMSSMRMTARSWFKSRSFWVLLAYSIIFAAHVRLIRSAIMRDEIGVTIPSHHLLATDFGALV